MDLAHAKALESHIEALTSLREDYVATWKAENAKIEMLSGEHKADAMRKADSARVLMTQIDAQRDSIQHDLEFLQSR